MNSHNANLFLALQARIDSLLDPQEKKYFPWNGPDLGQLEYYNPASGGRPPVAFPCTLIDIDSTDWKDLSRNTQAGVTMVKIRLGFAPYSSSSNLTPLQWREKSLEYYDLEQVLHQALQGWAPSYVVDGVDVLADVYGHFTRISAVTEKREDFYRVRELTYTIGHEDYTTKPTLTTVSALPVINAEFLNEE